jgi:4-carboxymuconolactone decarboxylase
LKLHLRATAHAGVSREEVKAILRHSAIQAGVPKANSAFDHARAVFEEIDMEQGQ